MPVRPRFCLWKKAPQSFAAEAAQSNQVMPGRGASVPEHHFSDPRGF